MEEVEDAKRDVDAVNERNKRRKLLTKWIVYVSMATNPIGTQAPQFSIISV